ncbi:MAG: NADH-quinone oxidoreductase subunit NuoN [Alphaproteobacteria bacterium]|nr:MAG: NADH-quinone oxidoreductase subunit NuoN [Alphaproteobacteria bacterium]TAF14668.1 MAG: NADH-quinone oxidoreductase subunit NuoN [Alphaproteobacteria bacterium]TAF41252.1 MAG: NADH-quinone oxidoreductase subunit NuoN [Alphaproteobacteria bacterium]TAF75764.1 MAG: NADH-quinone oxidoreductase subunit NuoN [Alphaproteobacteria bacterium]
MIPYTLIQGLYPEILLAGMAMFLLMYGAFFQSTMTQRGIALLGCSSLFTIFLMYAVQLKLNIPAQNLYGMVRIDSFATFAKIIIVLSAFGATILSLDWLKDHAEIAKEYVVLVLFATLGLVLLVASENLLSFYVALELASLAMYVMAAYERDNGVSSEAGLKYFVLGSLASGMMLFGVSLIYGFAGTIQFETLSTVLASTANVNIGAVTGIVLVLVGIFFKISAVPFHMWTPDVYEGAPTPVVAFFATAPKVAVLCFAVRFLSEVCGDIASYWQQIIVCASVASMVLGALAGLVQTNIKRLLAYSSIGHVGYILMAIAAHSYEAVYAMLVYLAFYCTISLGVFACILMLRSSGTPVTHIHQLAGLSTASPRIALALAVFMFSMAGIPPFLGFFGKFFVFKSVVQVESLIWLAVVGVLSSVVSCVYYIRIVKIMYFDESASPLDVLPRHPYLGYIIFACVVANFVVFDFSLIFKPAFLAAGVLFP